MLKWIIIIIVFFLVYRLIRRHLGSKTPAAKKAPDQIQDEMVQDPICQTYVPKRMALTVNRLQEGPAYFCSTACRDQYLAGGGNKKRQ
ncbi:MAG: transcriptional regulator [Deltaproteobacteria bacterium]|nr:transcriptional regulator [Deltaproteobacteria bacterium]